MVIEADRPAGVRVRCHRAKQAWPVGHPFAGAEFAGAEFAGAEFAGAVPVSVGPAGRLMNALSTRPLRPC